MYEYTYKDSVRSYLWASQVFTGRVLTCGQDTESADILTQNKLLFQTQQAELDDELQFRVHLFRVGVIDPLSITLK